MHRGQQDSVTLTDAGAEWNNGRGALRETEPACRHGIADNGASGFGGSVITLAEFLLILALAAAASLALNRLLAPLLARYALAPPNARSSHKVPTPQGGGIAVVGAVFAAMLAASLFAIADTKALVALWPIAAGVVLLAATGACDDILHLPVGPRFVLQFIAVAAVLAALPDEARVVPLLPWWVERAMLLIAGVYLVNIVNFMDGLDWMTVAEVVPVTAALWIASQLGALSPLDGALALAVLGGTLGFAPFNRPVAKLFLGDVGSLPLGLLLFWLLLRLAANGHLAAALLLPLYYVADASVTLVRRLARGDNVLRAHRTHFYQRATDLGFSVTDVVARVFLANIVLAALAIGSVAASSAGVSVAALALGIALVAGLLAHLSRQRSGIRHQP
jgi:UDP-N-acetylmuramyl pentapeptide phosphotransferase/UDP-N-acetylglucosamine-1-phosphate transferase